MAGTTVEHWALKSQEPDLAGDYSNCLYACRMCNRSRGTQELWADSGRLLNPTETAWGDHFTLSEDRLEPLPGDGDAAYTHRVYDLDDPRKTTRRRIRRELISDRLDALRVLVEIADLLRLADSLRREDTVFENVLQAIRRLRRNALHALKDLERYAAVPADAPTTCRCETGDHLTLPQPLAGQTFELPTAEGEEAGGSPDQTVDGFVGDPPSNGEDR